MIRAQFMRNGQESKDGFRLRGTDITRLEGFSDTVFGFAVTLLVVSLEVPTNFDNLLITMRDLVPFGLCFTILCLLWHQHYLFFRRYGLHDGPMIALNSVLLFLILAYVYPLKFLFRTFTGFWFGAQAPQADIRPDQVPELFVIYSLGWIAVYSIFTLFYVHAYRQRVNLELTSLEIFDTRSNIYANLGMIGIGLLSILFAALHVGIAIGLPGWVYFLIAPTQALIGRHFGAQHRALEAQAALEPPSSAPKDASAADTSS